MEKIREDADNIHRLLPWIESEDDIVDFICSVPIDNYHLRYQLTLLHFIRENDLKESDRFEQKIEDDAREIVTVLPETSYREIKERLRALGTVSNRKEVVIRHILNQIVDLDSIVQKMDGNRKRKSGNVIDIKGDDTNIKIKIRKSEGTLKVVSSITQEKSSMFRKFPVSADIDDNSSSSSSSDEFPNMTMFSGKKEQEQTVSNFNLVEYLQEVTMESVERIEAVCTQLGVPFKAKPPDAILNEILNRLFGIDVIDLDSPMNPSNEDDRSDSGVLMDIAENATSTSRPLNWTMRPATLFQNQNNDNATIVSSDTNDNISQSSIFDNSDFMRFMAEHDSYIDETSVTRFEPTETLVPRPEPAETLVPRSEPTETLEPCSEQTETLVPRSEPTETLIPRSEPTEILVPLSAPTETLIQRSERTDSSSKTNETLVPFSEPTNPPMIIDLPQRNIAVIDVPEVVLHDMDNILEPSNNILNLVKNETAVITETPTNDRNNERVDNQLVYRLMEMFPQACPTYIRRNCAGKSWNQFDDIVTVILDDDYPRRPETAPDPPKEFDPDEQLEIVKQLLPDADPNYLRLKCQEFGNNIDSLNEFINEARETKNYPTLKEYLRKKQLSAQSKQYTTEFNVKDFVQLFPDPKKTFEDPARVVNVDNYSKMYLRLYFQNRFDRLSVKIIRSVLEQNNYGIWAAENCLQKCRQFLKSRRKNSPLPDPGGNMLILQELAYINHKDDIEALVKEKQEQEKQEFEHAKENGLLNTCQCCYDEEVMQKNTVQCTNGCKACKECVIKSCEVSFGEGKTEFKCLSDCSQEYTLHTLQNVLPPKMFSRIAQKKALAEVKAAGIEELEMCPFCDFATIPNENDKIFRCLNPDCMKESCRSCKESNHLPLRCEEVEKDEDVKARVFIENRMTEALLRKCWKCGTSFFKEEGCNKMTCTCGAKMCYLCQQPVKDYTHFNGIGGDKHHLCPLYSDTTQVNKKNVIEAAKAAKAEIDPAKLLSDPSADVETYFNQRARNLVREPYLDLLNLPAMIGMNPRQRIQERNLLLANDYRRHAGQPRVVLNREDMQLLWRGLPLPHDLHIPPQGARGRRRDVRGNRRN